MEQRYATIGDSTMEDESRLLFRLSVFDERQFALTFCKLDSVTYDLTLERIRGFPERKWRRELKCWLVPFSAANIEYLRQTFDASEFSMDEEAGVVLRYMDVRDEVAERKEQRRWEYIFEDKVPKISYTAHREPYRHQTVALDALHNSPVFALLMEMGTGKTKVIIDEAKWQSEKRIEDGDKPFKVLVVCPRTLQRTWLQEFEKDIEPEFPYWAGRISTQVRGMKTLLEMARARVPLKFCILNYEKLGAMAKALMAVKFDMMVLDESTKIKNPSAHRTKNSIFVGESCARRAILTGAPVTNSILDLFSQFEFLENGILGYSTYYQYKDRFARFSKIKGRRWEKLTGWKNLDELKTRLAKHSFIVRKDQCLDLPPKTYEARTVEMTPKQAELYEQMLEMYLATLSDYTDPSTTMKAPITLVQLLRLCQICCDYIKTESGEEVTIPGGNPKLEALLEDIDALPPDAKVLVWARFTYDVRTITERLTKEKIGWVQLVGGMSDRDRDLAVDLFNGKNNVRVLVGEPSTGGYGLTLLGHKDNPCYTVYYYSNDFSLEKRMQSEDRCHRIGQVRPVTYVDIICENTIEEKIVAVLRERKELSDYMKDVSSLRAFLLGGRNLPDAVLHRAHVRVQESRVTTDDQGNVVVKRKDTVLQDDLKKLACKIAPSKDGQYLIDFRTERQTEIDFGGHR